MTSSILYRFNSERTFKVLQLQGSSARLFDIQKAIVQAHKLDRCPKNSNRSFGDFILVIRNASGAEYTDVDDATTVFVPRGTRLIVKRLPAPRGQGLLARIKAGNNYNNSSSSNKTNSEHVAIDGNSVVPPHMLDSRIKLDSSCITIDAHEDEEFIDSSSPSGTGNHK